jgi:hypothetical protein
MALRIKSFLLGAAKLELDNVYLHNPKLLELEHK